jgi:hypothetical protein
MLILLTGLQGAFAFAGQAESLLTLKDIGIRRNVDSREVVFWLDIANPAEQPLDGLLACREQRPTFFEDDPPSGQTVGMHIQVPPRGHRSLCFPVPHHMARPGSATELRLVDDHGVERARLRTDPTEDKLFWKSGDRLIGILATELATVQSIQEGILFAKEREGKDFFRLASAKFIYLSRDMNDCWQALRTLDDLIVALPAGELSGAQREAVRQAMFSGLRVVVVDSLPGNPAYLAAYSGSATGAATVGRGAVARASSINDEKVWAGLLKPQDEPRWGRRLRLEGDGSLAQLINMDAWVEPRYQRPRAPTATALLTFLGAYVLVLGPLSFALLRARNRRERAWLITPMITLAFSLVLVIWIQIRQFHERELDATVVLTSDQRWPEVQASVYARLSSPNAASYDVSVTGFIHAIEWYRFPDRKPIDVIRSDDSLELKHVEVPRWSSLDFTMEAHASAPAPVTWQETGIRNQLGVPFEEAVLLTSEGWFDIGGLAPGASFLPQPAARRPLPELIPLLRKGKPEERTRLLHALPLWDLNALEAMQPKLRAVRGVFIGFTRESRLRFTVEPAPEVVRLWTIYTHHFAAQGEPAEARP